MKLCMIREGSSQVATDHPPICKITRRAIIYDMARGGSRKDVPRIEFLCLLLTTLS